jgi:hypothetical protein
LSSPQGVGLLLPSLAAGINLFMNSPTSWTTQIGAWKSAKILNHVFLHKEENLIHVSLAPEWETLDKKHVKTGCYHSSCEGVRKALRVWEQQE